ncbi:metal ABC transporter solute-binding protein, Zn/Mn family [Pontibacillus sp. HMF3514]|uniref:metal ABC transporter solute-binding protein, Zn/Mn family n=1 Tax=Pontibacillus sp. HMF3514 TaxID=2692425 RepID=UPI00131F959A|nr:zinc ABC transporter substrate-binding protein [Pontibacillus sp. HMF3514]QHE53464.1 zinc ABC transporter solute-binding protein [Pontibacillus sp. HMF3514]
MKKIMAIMLMMIVTLMSACSSQESSSETGLKIYTSIYPIQYFTERIGGEHVNANSIYPPGVDAHTYEPTAKTMAEIATSDAFIYLGAGLEGFAESAADALADEKVQLMELGAHEELFTKVEIDKTETHNEHEEEQKEDHGHNHSGKDPHVWLDPLRSQMMANYIKEELVKLAPEHKKQFNENYEKLINDLESLHEQFKSVTQQADQNKLFVSHAAYGYWEQRYGIEQISVNGISPNNEPSQKDVKRLVEKAKKENVNYMIFEQNVSNQVASMIQKEIGAKSLTIHNLSVRTEQDIKEEQDYLSLMKHNLNVLEKALNN